MWNKALNTYLSMIQFIPECYKTQEISNKTVDTFLFVFHSAPDQYMTQEMSDKVVSKEPFMLKYDLDRFESQEMCDKVVESYLLPLIFLPNWFVASKMFEKLDNGVFFNDDRVFGDIDTDIVTSFSSDTGRNSINVNDINLDDDNFDDYDVTLDVTVLHLWLGIIEISNTRQVKKGR